MALSGSFDSSKTYYAPDDLYTWFTFSWTATQSIVNNSSELSYTITAKQNITLNTYQRSFYNSTMTINGSTISISSQKVWHGKVIKTGKITILHSEDGTKSFTASFNFYVGTTGNATNTGSKSFTLDTIPRATEITLDTTSMVINNSNVLGISLPRKVDTYTHTLTYTFGNRTDVLLAENVGTNFEWMPGYEILSAIPTETSARCTITCTTYNGTTAVGTSTASLIFSTDAVPVFGTPQLTNTTTNINGQPFTGRWLRYHSTGTLTIPASSSGTTIESYRITNNNQVIGSTMPVTLENLSDRVVTVVATDARGRSSSYDYVLQNWVDYVRPTVAVVSMTRDSSTSATSGATFELSGTVTYGYTANLEIVAQKDPVTGSISSYSMVYPNSDNTFSKTLNIGDGSTPYFERNSAYEITITLYDDFESFELSTVLKKAVPVFHFGNLPTPHFDVEGDLIIHGTDSKFIWIDDNDNRYTITLNTLQDILASLTPITRYTIMSTLTNVTNSNSAASVVENTSYVATLTPTSGYEITTISITMGGADITSTAYSNGQISISSVTGNVSITAVATAIPVYITGSGVNLNAIYNKGTEHDADYKNWMDFEDNTRIFTQLPSGGELSFQSDHFPFNGSNYFVRTASAKTWGTMEVVVPKSTATAMIFQTSASTGFGCIATKSNAIVFGAGGTLSVAMQDGVHTYACDGTKVYVDGVEATSANVTISWTAQDNWRIGCYANQTTYKYSNKLYAVRCYDAVLTAADILNNATVDKRNFGI